MLPKCMNAVRLLSRREMPGWEGLHKGIGLFLLEICPGACFLLMPPSPTPPKWVAPLPNLPPHQGAGAQQRSQHARAELPLLSSCDTLDASWLCTAAGRRVIAAAAARQRACVLSQDKTQIQHARHAFPPARRTLPTSCWAGPGVLPSPCILTRPHPPPLPPPSPPNPASYVSPGL